MEILDNERIIELYKAAVCDKLEYLKHHHDRISFYTSFFTAVLTLIFGGLLYSDEWFHYLILCIGPLLILCISNIAKNTSKKTYQTLIESYTVCAKYEQILGLTDSGIVETLLANHKDPYWQKEPIIPTRHLNNRRKYSNSNDFVGFTISDGQLGVESRKIYNLFQVFSSILIAILICLSISTYIQK